MNPPTILITGATDGIGLALARRYQERRVRLILIGRRPLASLTNPDPANPLFTPESYCQADLSQADAAQQIRGWLAQHGITGLDSLIHNAGMGHVGDLADQSPANIQALVQVNMIAPIALTHALFPLLKQERGEEGRARVAFISSVVSQLPAAQYAVYAATKAGLDGFARSLAGEWRDGPQVLVIHPGATRTGMHHKAGMTGETARFASPEAVAATIDRAIAQGRSQTTVGGLNRLLRFVGRYAAGPVDWAMIQAQKRQGRADAPVADTPVALITGFGDGIGRSLALAAARQGYAILGVDVDQARGEACAEEIRQAGGAVTPLYADLGQPAQVADLLARLQAQPQVTLLIHNAGISAVGRFEEIPLAQQEAVLRINLLAPLLLTQGLLARGQIAAGGSLVWLSSLSHHTGYPGAAAYAASKDGLASMGRSLRVALAGQGIHSLVVFPGPTRTAHARRYSPDNSREARRMLPETLADHIMRGVAQRRWVVIPGPANKLIALAGRLFPRLMTGVMRRALYLPLTSGGLGE
jgi:short-subunit dehydrogenase